MNSFSEPVQTALRASGWTPERRVSASHWIDELQREGFSILPKAVEILESLGGLKIRPKKAASDVYAPERLEFDPVLAASGEYDRVKYWESTLGIVLTPVAEIGGQAVLLIGGDGRVFSCWNDLLWLDGPSFEEAMENTLIVGKRWPVELARMSE